jgi:ABC-type glycerol-3-phosphate transport system substrate-binding protein
LSKLHLALLPALVLLLALGLAACGGGGESDEDKIVSTIEESVTSTDPSICAETQTLKFMEQTNSTSGKDAEKECEEETEEEDSDDPDSVDVSKVEAADGKASANVEFTGGTFDGNTLEVALVEEDGDWKLNELTGFAKFDATGFVAKFAEQLEEEPGIEPQVSSCIVEGLEEAPEDELESLVIENNTQPIVELAESCE